MTQDQRATLEAQIELPEPAFKASVKLGTLTGYFCDDPSIKKGDGLYTAGQVRQAIAKDRQRCGQQDDVDLNHLPPPSLRTAYHYAAFLRRRAAHIAGPTCRGAVKQAARMIDMMKLELDRQQRAEPFAWFQNSAPKGEPPHYEQVSDEYRGELDVFPLYAAPQSAGPVSELAEALKHWHDQSDGITVCIPVELAQAIYSTFIINGGEL